MIAALLAVSAHALVDRQICVEIDHDFLDTNYGAGTLRYDLDDFLNDDAVDEPYRGALIAVSRAGYFQQGYADDQTGCRTFTGLDTALTYTIVVFSDARVEGHTLELHDDELSPAAYSEIWANWQPSAFPVVTVKEIATGEREWNIMAAATFAIHRRDGGLSPQTFTMYNSPCPPGGTQCYNTTYDAIFVSTDRKFNVAHELGHYIAHRKLGTGAHSNLKALYGDCHGLANPIPSHELQQKEYQTGAFWEGFANFYAAVVFNRTTEPDCFMQHYKNEDYDLDGDRDPNTVNCAGVPWEDATGALMDTLDATNDPAVGEDDYFFDMTVDLSCDVGGVEDNRATELDYDRFLWGMIQEGMTLVQILDVVALADPDQFVNDDGQDAANQPAVRLQDGVEAYDLAHSTNFAPTWALLADQHGVDR